MNQPVSTSSTSKAMAKKSQTNSRRNNTQAGRRVVNFYNNGTVNIDARQNKSHTHRTENKGCTINYPFHPEGNMVGNYLDLENLNSTKVSAQVTEFPATNEQGNTETRKGFLKVAAGIAMAAVAIGVSIAFIKARH